MASITVEKEKMVDLVKLYPQPRRRKIFGKRKGGKYLEKKIGEEKRSRGGRKIVRGGKYFLSEEKEKEENMLRAKIFCPWMRRKKRRRKGRKIFGEGKYLVRVGEEEQRRKRRRISWVRKVMTDRQTHRISYCRIDSVEGVQQNIMFFKLSSSRIFTTTFYGVTGRTTLTPLIEKVAPLDEIYFTLRPLNIYHFLDWSLIIA